VHPPVGKVALCVRGMRAAIYSRSVPGSRCAVHCALSPPAEPQSFISLVWTRIGEILRELPTCGNGTAVSGRRIPATSFAWTIRSMDDWRHRAHPVTWHRDVRQHGGGEEVADDGSCRCGPVPRVLPVPTQHVAPDLRPFLPRSAIFLSFQQSGGSREGFVWFGRTPSCLPLLYRIAVYNATLTKYCLAFFHSTWQLQYFAGLLLEDFIPAPYRGFAHDPTGRLPSSRAPNEPSSQSPHPPLQQRLQTQLSLKVFIRHKQL